MTSTVSSPAILTVRPPRAIGFAERLREAAGTTPGRYRLWSLAGAVALLFAIVATVSSATQMRSSAQRAETNSGPVLVATQQVVSSLAEADAAATAAFLSGRDEDPEQRRLYEQALARTVQQVDDIASLSGQDATIRAAVGRISVQVSQFGGLVEAARASNRAGSPDAAGYLVAAVRLAEQLVTGDVKVLAGAAQANLQHDEGRRTRGLAVAELAASLALLVLVGAQLGMVLTFRRILNVPLMAGTILALVGAGWLLRAAVVSGHAQATARLHGYDSLVLTSELGRAGFGAKTAETLAVITGDAAQRGVADADARQVAGGAISAQTAELIRQGRAAAVPIGLIAQVGAAAGTPRERAAVADVALRWQRFEDTVGQLRSAPDAGAARAIAVGAGNSDFNGFNFALAAVLGQNRDRFQAGLASAAGGTSGVPTGVAVLLVAALAATVWGFQLRISEYR